MRGLLVVLVGWLFAVGLGVSGMTNVDAVIGFLNLRGDWDPSLLGVMGGAIVVYAIAFAWITRRRERPVHEVSFSLPTRKDIDRRLVIGAMIFGVGWGIAGVCPGPGLTSTVTGAQSSLAFVAAMLVGMFAYQRTLGGHWKT